MPACPNRPPSPAAAPQTAKIAGTSIMTATFTPAPSPSASATLPTPTLGNGFAASIRDQSPAKSSPGHPRRSTTPAPNSPALGRCFWQIARGRFSGLALPAGFNRVEICHVGSRFQITDTDDQRPIKMLLRRRLDDRRRDRSHQGSAQRRLDLNSGRPEL
jgi:hypothetical protein